MHPMKTTVANHWVIAKLLHNENTAYDVGVLDEVADCKETILHVISELYTNPQSGQRNQIMELAENAYYVFPEWEAHIAAQKEVVSA